MQRIWVLLLMLAWSGMALAEEVKMFKSAPAPEEVEKLLAPPPASKGVGLKTRSIVIGGANKPAENAPPPPPQAFGFNINFALNSVEILPEYRPYIDAVGKALKMGDAASVKVVIEGHTDASGTDAHNNELSQRRAEAVKAYLVANHGIGKERLSTFGKGKAELLNKADPLNADNRRVQFRRVD